MAESLAYVLIPSNSGLISSVHDARNAVAALES